MRFRAVLGRVEPLDCLTGAGWLLGLVAVSQALGLRGRILCARPHPGATLHCVGRNAVGKK
jgi:hypothetical protein